MSGFVIRHSTPADLPAMLAIYEYARGFMARTGNPTQWVGYPDESLLMSDIEKGVSYAAESDGAVRGTFALFEGDDDTYRVIENGAWLNDEPYVTIHRVASDGTVTGLMPAAVDFALSKCANVRIDTHADNAVMRHILANLGFTYCGIIHTFDGSPRLAFQKERT